MSVAPRAFEEPPHSEPWLLWVGPEDAFTVEFVTEIPFPYPGQEDATPLHEQPVGQSDKLDRTIKVRTSEAGRAFLRSFVLDTLLHEILHVCFHVSGYDPVRHNEEAVISALSPRLTDIVTDPRNRPLLALFG